MLDKLKKCEICPHNCKVNRLDGKMGRCKCNDKVKLALASVHRFEEPCISGKNGSDKFNNSYNVCISNNGSNKNCKKKWIKHSNNL